MNLLQLSEGVKTVLHALKFDFAEKRSGRAKKILRWETKSITHENCDQTQK